MLEMYLFCDGLYICTFIYDCKILHVNISNESTVVMSTSMVQAERIVHMVHSSTVYVSSVMR